MKILKLTIIFFLFCAPSMAAPRWLTAVPRAIGRGYGNMVTFKHPGLALEQWATLGVVILDQKTTVDAFARCQTCAEGTILSPWYGKRYGVGTAILQVGLTQTIYSSTEQYSYELLKDDPNPYWRSLRFAEASIPLAVHIHAALSNMQSGTK